MSNKSPFGTASHFANMGSWKASSPAFNPQRLKVAKSWISTNFYCFVAFVPIPWKHGADIERWKQMALETTNQNIYLKLHLFWFVVSKAICFPLSMSAPCFHVRKMWCTAEKRFMRHVCRRNPFLLFFLAKTFNSWRHQKSVRLDYWVANPARTSPSSMFELWISDGFELFFAVQFLYPKFVLSRSKQLMPVTVKFQIEWQAWVAWNERGQILGQKMYGEK